MPLGRPEKKFHEYIVSAEDGSGHVTHEQYVSCPASAFLRYSIEAKDAIDYCRNNFKKNNDGNFNEASTDSLQHLIVAMLPALMGHFETFERYLFAGVFERSVYLKDFDVDKFFSNIRKARSFEIDPKILAAHRDIGSASIGMLMADSLKGWQNPSIVNEYFRAFQIPKDLFSAADQRDLRVLWQFRHSIVHTGGTLTRADAQKVKQLDGQGGQQLIFADNFILEVARKVHALVQRSVGRYSGEFASKCDSDIDENVKAEIANFFKVSSTYKVWL